MSNTSFHRNLSVFLVVLAFVLGALLVGAAMALGFGGM